MALRYIEWLGLQFKLIRQVTPTWAEAPNVLDALRQNAEGKANQTGQGGS